MKILLTGKPRSGKSTLIKNLINTTERSQGFLSQEVLEGGERIGFDLVAANGDKAVLARVDLESSFRVGRYGVDVSALDGLIDALPEVQHNDLLYLDEIGHMELASDKFKRLVKDYLDSPNAFIGIISMAYSDNFTKEVLARPQVILMEVTAENKEQLGQILEGLVANRDAYTNLPAQQQAAVFKLAQGYAKQGTLTQLQKLFRNAIKYVAEGRVARVNDGLYEVSGNTARHVVKKAQEAWSCDCDLFNARGLFEGNAGECSHIQSVQLFIFDTMTQ